VSGSGISCAICKSAPCSRQITMPAPHCSVFYGLDALPATQPTVSKHWWFCQTNLKNNLNSVFWKNCENLKNAKFWSLKTYFCQPWYREISCTTLLKLVTAQIMFTGAFVESLYYGTVFCMVGMCAVIFLDCCCLFLSAAKGKWNKQGTACLL